MDNNQSQPTLTIEEEQEQALLFIMENELYTKFMMWLDIKQAIKENVEKINQGLDLE